MDFETQHQIDTAYQNGKLDVLNVLASVLASMKFQHGDITSQTLNRILDEIYQKVEIEVK